MSDLYASGHNGSTTQSTLPTRSTFEETLSQTAVCARTAKIAVALTSVIFLTACAQNSPQRIASAAVGLDKSNKYGVPASPRVVEEGQEVPKGGGRYQVGKPYQVGGKTYYPSERTQAQVGLASWYGRDFHGRKTANGEIFDRTSYTAAHRTMPLPSYARVTNTRNGHSMVVRINDRGPYHGNRLIDVSQNVAEALDFKNDGVGRVKVEYLRQAGIYGSDDVKLLATLRTDGSQAQIEGAPAASPVMTAERETQATEAVSSLPSNRRSASARSSRGQGEASESSERTVAYAPDPLPRPKTLAHSSHHGSEGAAGSAHSANDEPTKTSRKNAHDPINALAYAGQNDYPTASKGVPVPLARPASLKPTPVDDDSSE